MMDPLRAPIRVAIAETDVVEIGRIRALLEADPHMNVVGTAQDRGQLPLLQPLDPDIVLLSTRLAPDDTPSLVKQFFELTPNAQVLLLAPAGTEPDIRRAMLAGARGILHLPLGADELLSTIREVMGTEVTRRQRVQEVAQERLSRATQGRVIAVFSPKGGVGCTLLACNLAVAMQRITGKPTALVDYSLQFGTVASVLNLQSLHSVAELMPVYDALDATILDDVMVRHESGLRVLLAPARLADVELITMEGLVGVLAALRLYYVNVVVDLWHTIEDATVAILEAADVILLVTTPEVPALYTTRRFLELLKDYPQLQDRVQLVVNRHPSKGAVDLQQIEHSLGCAAVATVPSDGFLMTTAVNEGVPLVRKNANTVFAQNVAKLATELGGERSADGRTDTGRGGIFSRGRRRS